MSSLFSFNEPVVNAIIRMIPAIVPGIERVISVYYSPASGSVISAIYNPGQEENNIETFALSDNRSIMNRFRMESSACSWLQKSDLPFHPAIKGKVQLDIFNEFENNILLIRIQNHFDYLNDLFFIYFNPQSGSFGPVTINKIFSPDNRAVIAQMLRNSILFMTSKMKEDQELFFDLSENNEHVVAENSSLKKEISGVREKYKEGITKLSVHYLNSLAEKNHRSYHLSKEAENKLSEYEGNLATLESIIRKATHVAELASADPYGTVEVAAHHIILSEKHSAPGQEEKQGQIRDLPVRYSKTLLLLNKLETAALRVKARNEVLTSANIGNELPVRITPPAISDALKKHRSKIVHLLREYPDKWEIIRNEFRPIRNIMSVKDEHDQLTA